MAIDISTPIRSQAFIFPGQAAQAVGMGKDLFDNSPAAREIFNEVDDALVRNLTTLMFEGPIEELTETSNAQPAVSAVSLAAHAAMTEALGGQPIPALTAGHSLGEYSALAVSGVLSISDTLRIEDNISRGDLDGLANLTSIGDDLDLTDNISLVDVDGLSNLTSVQGWVVIHDNPILCQSDVDAFVAAGEQALAQQRERAVR